jgi:lysophospholipase L1-like esterase
MNFLLLGKALALVLLLLAPGYFAARRFGIRVGLPILALAFLLLGTSGILLIWNRQPLVEVVVGSLLAVLLFGAVFAPQSWVEIPGRVTAIPGGEIIAILLFSIVVPFGLLEWGARFGTDMKWVTHHRPMKTWRKHGIEDWRRFHVTADTSREQDPVLFWRPKPGGAFSAQRFKSRLVEVPKPDGVFRIMAYGDSNTEGTPFKSWPANLQTLLDSRATRYLRYEVMNAGVAGYSSYQGMRRLQQESETYEPDLILVSFGWNDVPEAVDQPDSSFQPTSDAMVDVLRVLFRSRLYLVIENYAVAHRVAAGAKQEYARVSIQEYIDNMRSFDREAKQVNSEIVFLTRPHRAIVSELRQTKGWRSRVPLYNDALRDYARRDGVHLIDIQRHFEIDHDGMFGDETHFTEAGRAEMGRLLVFELTKARLLPR